MTKIMEKRIYVYVRAHCHILDIHVFQRVGHENDFTLNLGPSPYSGKKLCIIQITPWRLESPGSTVPVGGCV